MLALAALGGFGYYLSRADIPVFQPGGPIAQKEKHLIIIAVLLSAIVVIPVYIMLFSFAWKYRESNKKAKYSPSFSHSRLLESIWWGVPLAIITILGVITWKSSIELDPFKALNSSKPPITIQAISLQWKWLFIYPQQNIASVNYVQFPLGTPIDFEITSDAPMNSFWIPKLGGQIYAMSGMSTHMHLLADRPGSYRGVSANISGAGFAGMHFEAKSVDNRDFQLWVSHMHLTQNSLGLDQYKTLAAPSQDNPVSYYSSVASGLYNSVVAKYESPIYIKPAEASQ